MGVHARAEKLLDPLGGGWADEHRWGAGGASTPRGVQLGRYIAEHLWYPGAFPLVLAEPAVAVREIANLKIVPRYHSDFPQVEIAALMRAAVTSESRKREGARGVRTAAVPEAYPGRRTRPERRDKLGLGGGVLVPGRREFLRDFQDGAAPALAGACRDGAGQSAGHASSRERDADTVANQMGAVGGGDSWSSVDRKTCGRGGFRQRLDLGTFRSGSRWVREPLRVTAT